ncbi:hypothetical protein [Niveispirillum sp. BGYR6]|uniref:hypothetical protein n=1 Tax=Niveispirillum sp. BGYR6 TaxID=2971249 RepID=UPI0022B9B4ED|nr:hypothetical protein [Niveispirillum sp. BGYR6]MDG5495559.1 hypothetical protein [Niveispirillum sp. BGYR6]
MDFATRSAVITRADSLFQVLDSHPETEGIGVVVIADRTLFWLRPVGADGSYLVIEIRDNPLSFAGLPPATLSRFQAMPRDAGLKAQQALAEQESRPAPAPKKPSFDSPRSATTSPAMEWLGLGLNCGGAVLAWVGVVTTGALTPITGGLSAFASLALWTGAVSSTMQCAVSTYRVGNLLRDRDDINASLDNNSNYIMAMYGLDGIGLITAGGAVVEAVRVNSKLTKVGSGLFKGASQSFSRRQRLHLTTELGLKGVRRAPAEAINKIIKKQVMDTIGAAVGIVGSSSSGIVKDIIIWVVSPHYDENTGSEN